MPQIIEIYDIEKKIEKAKTQTIRTHYRPNWFESLISDPGVRVVP